jgi:hypothetical protein
VGHRLPGHFPGLYPKPMISATVKVTPSTATEPLATMSSRNA